MKRLLLPLALLVITARGAFAADDYPVWHTNDIVLFQGDSITDGARARTGNDYNHTMGQDYAYIISAKIGAALPERNLTFINRGNSGNGVGDLTKRWQADTLDLKPNFLSILIGVNDTLRGMPADQFEKVYDKLLSDTIAALPNTKIILGQPFLLPVGEFKDTYAKRSLNIKERQDAVERIGAKYHLTVIHFQAAFDAACQKAPADHWSWDGIHPTYAGHGLMVEEWLAAVRRTWPNG